jgi:hypothetical protein
MKYKVPKELRSKMNNKKTIYCKIKKVQELKMSERKIYLVNMINYGFLSNMFMDYELEKLNMLDNIKIKFKLI